MKNLIALRSKWLARAKKRLPYPSLGYDCHGPGKFIMHISDWGGQIPCVSSVEVTGFLDSARDALAYIRFAAIPHILEWDSGTWSGEPLGPAEAYLSGYNKADIAKNILELLEMVDRALVSDEITSEMLSPIREFFNQTFKQTNPSFQILAWGSLTETLNDPYFTKIFDYAERHQSGETWQSMAVLKNLLMSHKFDENNEEHLQFAREFFERCIVA